MFVPLARIWSAPPNEVIILLQTSTSTDQSNRILLAQRYHASNQLVEIDRVWVAFPNFASVMSVVPTFNDGLIKLNTPFFRKVAEMAIVFVYADAEGPAMDAGRHTQWMDDVNKAYGENIRRVVQGALGDIGIEDAVTEHPIVELTWGVADPLTCAVLAAQDLAKTLWKTTLSHIHIIEHIVRASNINAGPADVKELAISAMPFPIKDQQRYKDNILSKTPIFRQTHPVNPVELLEELLNLDIDAMVHIGRCYYIYALWDAIQCLPDIYATYFTTRIEDMVAKYGCLDVFVPTMEVPVHILDVSLVELFVCTGGPVRMALTDMIQAYTRPLTRAEVMQRLLTLP